MVLEIISCRQVYSVGIIGLTAEIKAPAVEVLYAKLHIVCHIIEEVGNGILSFLEASGVGFGKAFAYHGRGKNAVGVYRATFGNAPLRERF
mgnify:CR=1 FL=1